jgi:hypothetical protein
VAASGLERHLVRRSELVAVGGIVLQKSTNERSAPKNEQYQNPKGRFRESKSPIQDLI